MHNGDVQARELQRRGGERDITALLDATGERGQRRESLKSERIAHQHKDGLPVFFQQASQCRHGRCEILCVAHATDANVDSRPAASSFRRELRGDVCRLVISAA